MQPNTFTFDAEREMAEAEAEAYAGWCRIHHLNPADPDTRQSWAVYLDALDEHPHVDPDQDRYDDDERARYWPDDEHGPDED